MPVLSAPANLRLVWHDEFNGTTLDPNKWQYYASGKRRQAINSPDCSFLDGTGHLILEARKLGNEIHAGMLATDDHFSTTYGRFECRAKLPQINGIWPAFWLMSRNNVEGSHPESGGAEIDIFEYFHNSNPDSVSHTLHWGGYGKTHAVAGPVCGKLQKTPDGYHVFALEWTENSYTTFVDGIKTSSTTNLISHVPEFILLSLEVDESVAGPLNVSQLPGQFVVDYVRVYQK